MSQKTLDGIERGKLEGVYKGRKVGSVESDQKFLSKPKVRKIKVMLELNVGIRQISRIVECSPNYIYKVRERVLVGN